MMEYSVPPVITTIPVIGGKPFSGYEFGEAVTP